MSKKSVPALLFDLIDYANRMRDIYLACGSHEQFLEDRVAQDAVLWNIVVIGEVSNRLGKEFQSKYQELSLSRVIGLRNIVAHGYDIIDWDILRKVIQEDLPKLITTSQALLDEYGPPPEI